jgi:hypothetical protein
VQVPTFPARAQDWQVPAQAVAQQTPWAQAPVAHSLFAAHVAPTDFLTQLPPMQKKVETQSVSAAHDVLHAPEPH